jgi:(2Fe-2S) ferredoxin
MPDSFKDRLLGLTSRVVPGSGLALVVGYEDGFVWYLRVTANDGRDNVTGEPLSPHMTDGEIVQTAFLAVMTALEHEAREQFTFDGVSVFDPHYDIHELVRLRKEHPTGGLKGRD